jgi:tetratricopeptide (TPR) repeat protein
LAKIEQKVGNKIGFGNALNLMGIVTSDMGDFTKALEFHYQAERIRFEIGDDSGLIQTLYNIGMEWLRIKNAEKAVDYFILAGYIAKKKGMNFEMKQMEWVIKELIKKHGEDEFMRIGEKLYERRILHFK